MNKYLLSLVIATAFVCEYVSEGISRCENDEAVCYIYNGHKKGGMSCKFKEQSDE